ncbi:MAG: hypothetical protein IKR23_09655 [Lachnospiraceae bacterium]|nr:hypothetical protein [Lachnospiraceae bacterium]
MSDKLNEDPDIIDLDKTGAITPAEELPKEVTMDTQLLTDVSAEIALSMENTQPLADIKALAEAIEKTQTAIEIPDGETRVIDSHALDDTMVIMDLDSTSELSGLMEEIDRNTGELMPADEAAGPDGAYEEDYVPGGEYGEDGYVDDPDAVYEGEDYADDPDAEYVGDDYDPDAVYDEDEYIDDPAIEAEAPEEEYDDELDAEIDPATGLYLVSDEDEAGEDAEGEDVEAEDAAEADAVADTEAETDEADAGAAVDEEADARLFETGEIMHLEEERTKRDNEAAPIMRKTPANIFAVAIAVFSFIALCVIIGVASYKNRSVAENKPYMYDVGERLNSIGTAGQSGLMAMANADHGSGAVPEDDEETDPDTVQDPDALIYVKLSFTSVAKDIKLKFINSGTERLVTDEEFEVVLTDANGEKLRLVDEDRDGIIYKKDVAGGEYKLAVVDRDGYDFVSVPGTVTVKENISYQKIDVKEEIKKENEVNAAVEDTGNGKEPEEGPPPTPTTGDTVEWVESTKTAKEGSDGYKPVDKADIPEPDYSEGVVAGRDNKPVTAAAGTANGGSTICGSDDPTPGSTPTPIPIPTGGSEPAPGDDDDDPTPTPTKEPDDPDVTPGVSTTPTPTDKDGKKDPKKDKTTKLKDKNGNQLYVKKDDKYEEAVYADYYKAEAFYVASEIEYVYTGWQTLDGKTYYFDKNGNKVTGDQIIKGVKYHFDEYGVLDGTGKPDEGNNNGGNSGGGKGILGIDVSKWNGTIDWNAVKASGVNFAIIRCGYRGSSTGVLVEDPTFRANIEGAQAAGIKVGLYFFTQAVNEVEAVEEASMCLSLAQGYSVSYPIFIDVEFTVNKNGRADGLDRATRSAVARAFCETINNGGYAGGVYSSKSWYGYSLDMGVIGGYKIWLAHYTSQTDYAGHYDIWQYSSKGSISGIKGNVDMNYSYMGY